MELSKSQKARIPVETLTAADVLRKLLAAAEAGQEWTRKDLVEVLRGAVKTPRRKKPVHPRTVAKEALTESEQQLVIAAADEMSWERRATEDGYGGFDVPKDPTFVGRTIRVLMFSMVHVSLLPYLTRANLLRVQGGRLDGLLLLQWHRTKPTAGGHRRLMMAVVPTEYEPWIAAYLDLPKPKSSGSYRYLLTQLEEHIWATRKVRIHLNPLRFRHTGGHRYRDQLNLNQEELANVLGVSKGTATYYTTRNSEAVLEAIGKQKGLRLENPERGPS
ncbi:MAG: hypothetical protein KGI89_03065 [Euryarchaeota archaeon]|nr:hypothetical protein [Euryarchaeota archaeon]